VLAAPLADGLDKTGDTLAKTVADWDFMPMHITATNQYSRRSHLVAGRLAEQKIECQATNLNALIALNQDTIERHAPEVESGGIVLFNADKLRCNIPCGTMSLLGHCDKYPDQTVRAVQPVIAKHCCARWRVFF